MLGRTLWFFVNDYISGGWEPINRPIFLAFQITAVVQAVYRKNSFWTKKPTLHFWQILGAAKNVRQIAVAVAAGQTCFALLIFSPKKLLL